MASPNPEQQKAIHHTGGVLLSAGAGSGKTFVLKEHLIYLSRCLIEDSRNDSLGLDDFSEKVKRLFKRTVLMTFTKKAAGELNIRLISEFSKLRETDGENAKYWDAVFNQISFLNVSTIHGFCFKLITMGIFPGVSGDQKILSDSEHKDKIWNLCSEELVASLPRIQPALRELILKERKSIFSSVEKIFSDPSLRYSWSKLQTSELRFDLSTTLTEISKEYGIDGLHESFPELEAYSDLKGKTWFDFMAKIKPFINSNLYTPEGIGKLIRLLDDLKFRIPNRPRPGKIEPELIDYYSRIIALKDFLKAFHRDLIAFFEQEDESIDQWVDFVISLVRSVESKYSKTEGITFSDMEYIVYKNLQDPKIAELVQDEFDYIIVDEFQDTSFIQYSILKTIADNDFKKLFCVGDLKQAIYGFRGGELGVFLECEENMPQNLSLKNNYRSAKKIINFNNNFFEFLFKLGPKYEGRDPHTVLVEYQSAPETLEIDGDICKLVVDALDKDEKYSNQEIEYLEALTIREKIESLVSINQSCAVLYKKLKPSLILINLLMERNIGFSAQVKIPFPEDPILGIFNTLVEGDLNVADYGKEYQLLLVRSYLQLLKGDELETNLDHELTKFQSDRDFYGLYQAFYNFLYRLGVRTSNFNNNLDFLKSLISAKGSDSSTLYKLLKEQKDNSYSMEFEFGENSQFVKIMSAHASKGLQFQNVILGGIYTNDKSMPMVNLVGKLPFSFKWVDSIYGKNKYKSPQYILEDVLTKNKEFSENKRLFYVACTRAEVGLFWVHINWGENKRNSTGSSSWSSGLNKWCDTQNLVDVSEIEFNVEKVYDETFLTKLENKPPFFHTDSLGSTFVNPSSALSLVGEMSVTKLALISGCPRKFYFENICKISEEEIELLENANSAAPMPDALEEELSSSSILKSSAKRGSEIHEYLSELIMRNFESIGSEISSLSPVVENLKEMSENFHLISEKPIKSELMGYMISGIPDLILQPKKADLPFEVWDFKTGRFSEDKLAPYYFQLTVYAYFHYYQNPSTQQLPSKLVLYFVDEDKKVEYNVTLNDVENYLIEQLEKIDRPELKNISLCDTCKFNSICDK